MDLRSRTEVEFVSVIVPHYHDMVGLDLCLGALQAQTYPRDRFEIIVADNASSEGREAIEATIGGRARLEIVQERGAGPARNGGAAVSKGAIFAFTDADCVPEPEWLSEGVAGLAQFDIVGGRVKVLVADQKQMTPEEAFESVFAFDNETYVNAKGFTVTANMLCRRDVFQVVGGFRVGVPEDKDWSIRARELGFRLGYQPLAIVGHPARRTWPALRGKWERLNREAYGLFASQRHRRPRWLARNALLPISAVVDTLKVLRTHELTSWKQRMGAISVLYRLRLWRMFDALNVATSR